MRTAILFFAATALLCADNPIKKLNPHPKRMGHFLATHKKLEAVLGGTLVLGMVAGKVWLDTSSSSAPKQKATPITVVSK